MAEVKYKYEPVVGDFWNEEECTPEGFTKGLYVNFLKEFFEDERVKNYIEQNKFVELFDYFLSISARKNYHYVLDVLTQLLYVAGIEFEDYVPYSYLRNKLEFTSSLTVLE